MTGLAVRAESRAGARGEIRDDVREELGAGVRMEIRDGVRMEIRDGVRMEIRDGLRMEIRDDLRVVLPEGTGPPAAVPREMFAAAVDAYLSGRRLDMQSLARRLGVGRATLYRRAGNREQLLDEVIWWRTRRMVTGQVLATASLRGAARIASVISGALRAIAQDQPLHAFIDYDPETALRILTGSRSLAGRGILAALANLIDLERSHRAFEADLDSATLAYAIIRISEGFLYADVIADRAPDIGRAITVIQALLQGLDRAA